MSKWYIDKIKADAPDLLDGNTADIMDWIDNAFAMYAEDEDIVIKMVSDLLLVEKRQLLC